MQIRCNFPDISYLSETQKNNFQFFGFHAKIRCNLNISYLSETQKNNFQFSNEKGVHVDSNLMNGSFYSYGDLRMHHKYTL